MPSARFVGDMAALCSHFPTPVEGPSVVLGCGDALSLLTQPNLSEPGVPPHLCSVCDAAPQGEGAHSLTFSAILDK